MNRLGAETIDAALHLLDRQVVDVDGLMVCNVDDLEITDTQDGRLTVTGLLAGGAALVPRFSGRAGHWLRTTWHDLGVEQAERDVPLYIGLALIDRLGSAVDLKARRDALLAHQPLPAEGTTDRRMSDLLGMQVHGGEGRLGNVLDVRLKPSGDAYPVHQLIVGRGRPGSLLGYDRGNVRGPVLVRWTVRHLHRHTGEVGWDRVRSVDWERSEIRVDGGLDPLTSS